MITLRLAVATLLLAALAAPASHAQDRPASEETLVYVGTYTTGGESQGIHLFRLPSEGLEGSQNIALAPLGLAAETPSPSFLVLDARRRLVFAVNEVSDFRGQPGGAVSAFAIEPQTGHLALINQQSSRGAGPCHIALAPDGRHVLVANYGGGSVAVLPVDKDGRLGEATDFVQHEGRSVHPQRQTGPHAHCVTLDPAGKFAFVCDLGLDQVLAYRFDATTGTLTPHDPPYVAMKPGAGPRHMAFRPDGRFAYIINELDSTVAVLAYDADAGRFAEVQTISTLPPHFDRPNTTAEIAVHPNGRFLYASNRGRDSVVLFAIDGSAGTLAYIDELSTGGRTPRHFGIEPNGERLVIANQNSGSLLVCRIDGATGRLKPAGAFAECPAPACAVVLSPTPAGR